MTTDPADPLPNDEPTRAAGAGGPAPTTWEVDETTGPEAVAWEPADESPAFVVEPGAKAPASADVPGPDDGLVARAEPWRLSHLMLAIAVVAVLLWLGINLGIWALILAPFFLVVLVVTAGFVAARLRASRQEALLSLLAIAAERDMPLAPAVAAFADQFRGRSQRRILNVVARLNAGEPLPEALRYPHRVASRDALLLARVGHEVGRLAPALRLVGGPRQSRIGAWSAIASRLTYLIAVLMVAESISGFLLYFILPKFEAIFKDFGVRLPVVTVFTIQFSHLIVRSWPMTLLIYLAQLGLVVILPFTFGGWMNYRVPIVDRLLGRRHAALVLRALSVVIEAGRPIGLGLDILAEEYPAGWVRRRLARAAADVRGGADWIGALLRRGVIRKADAELLASAASVGNLPWACRELADTAERRQQLRIQVLIQALFPLAVLAIGLAVAILCLGYFAPIITLIQSLTEDA